MATAAAKDDTTTTTMETTPEDTTTTTTMEDDIDVTVVNAMLEACAAGNLNTVEQIVQDKGGVYACQQCQISGASPLMAAAAGGHGAVCQYLLEAGAPWNAIDRQGQCAGNYATDHQHWGVVNLLVEWGTRAELILGMVERLRREENGTNITMGTATTTTGAAAADTSSSSSFPVEHEPCTKPDYLRQRLQYTADGQSLLDADQDAVMMEWERPLMRAHAEILMEPAQGQHNKRVLNVGFGMGIIDSALQEWQPAHHIIIEAHPDVYRRMLETGWDKLPTVRICLGKWQDVLPQLIAEGVVVDAIFYDTVRCEILRARQSIRLVPRCSHEHVASIFICLVRGTFYGFGRLSRAHGQDSRQTGRNLLVL
jgi:type IV protein arginine methyltransferase